MHDEERFPLIWSGCRLFCGHIPIGEFKEEPFAAGAGPGPWFGSLGWGYPRQHEEWFDSEDAAKEALVLRARELLSASLDGPRVVLKRLPA